ncbi:hypothetical protein O2N63_01390 [Aliiroseovarius sp. KMU-50]|uniref:Uncharacterized protein n=1 Tax=Aliiroseovarius salicola TaxID=3009082 RepID=A0ABT4VWV5_9RHOB|nr:hypothetical protein [Aliiroseovarius sp. KMU-50]MDA5092738.1 hypothetical protein [Aliiroseovarius sp. KMU-50]
MKFSLPVGLFAVTLCAPLYAETLYPNSVVSNDLEFIKTSDPSVYECLRPKGRAQAEMPDKRGGPLMVDNTIQFDAIYSDGASVDIWVHPSLGSSATTYATHAAEAIGKLPSFMRSKLDHVVILKGDESAFSEDMGHFFVLYSENMNKRISTHDLEETVFHESVHATLDAEYARSSAWEKAQRRDGGFLTEYAQNNPNGEDMAETALFAYAMTRTPGRLPAAVESGVKDAVPNRLAFLTKLFSSKPQFYKVGSATGC